jgi:hypothetical protein
MHATENPTSTAEITTAVIQQLQLIDTKAKAKQLGVSEETLNGWRFRDRREGRAQALPGFPRYFKYGKCVRYLPTIDDSLPGGAA